MPPCLCPTCPSESHVDRSINGPSVFVQTNVLGTQTVLEAVRQTDATRSAPIRFVHVSTDEVYGSLGTDGCFTEESPWAPNNPYAASKAGGDAMVRAYHRTYGTAAIITRSTNNYGPYQYPEKLIPYFITGALEGLPLAMQGDGRPVRDWLHVLDHCRALDLIAQHGTVGRVYHVGGGNERTVKATIQFILAELGVPWERVYRIADRPSQDMRYSLDTRRIRTELGWAPLQGFEDGLRETMQWYASHRDWWLPLMSNRIA